LSSKRPDAIVFDFDLTLVDSLAGFVESHAFAARAVGFEPPAPATISRTIGTPLPEAFRTFYGPEQDPFMETYLRHYQQRADQVMTDATVFLAGAESAIERLHAAGLPLAIVSQKLRYRVEDVLRRASLLDAFSTIIGGDDVPALKPDPAGLLLAIERLQAKPAASLYVGDTVIDAETAQRAGVPFIAVLSGFHKREEFAGCQPIAFLDSVAMVPRYVGIA